ncbi:hypothetical protein Pelo_15071 [Pelomyxa schiedti]|nr:hypothetical protein Pelo_15071 [Pelomyxa schiedti]
MGLWSIKSKQVGSTSHKSEGDPRATEGRRLGRGNIIMALECGAHWSKLKIQAMANKGGVGTCIDTKELRDRVHLETHCGTYC